MTTLAVVAPSKPKEAQSPLIQQVNLSSIKPSKANPRRHMDEAALAELAANIKTHGVLQPVLIRPVAAGAYEIVCGERRWRASKIADKATIPARIVSLSDAEALEFAVIENLQREDVHELDQANGFKALMQQNPILYTVETIAAKVGRSASFVYQRLKLAELVPSVQKAFYEAKLTAGHAIEIARLQPADQERALRECFPSHTTTNAILKEKDPRPLSVRDLRDWIQREVHLSLANAPFDVNDASLMPTAGPCSTCPKRSGANPLLFADSIPRKDVCTDRECFSRKVSALVQIRVKQAEDAGEKPVRVSECYPFYGHKAQPGVTYRSDYHEAKAAGECPTTTTAVMVEGKQAGRKLYVCTNAKCQTHTPHSGGLSAQEKAERKKQAEALRIQQEYRRRLLEEVLKRVPEQLTRHELDVVALRYFEQLGHDNQHRIFKFFRWDLPNSNCSYAGYVDYPKLASAKLEVMTAATLGKFLVLCAVASDLYCPTYVGGATLGKDSQLVKQAVHYKVNGERILRELKEQGSRKSAKPDNHKLQTSAKAKARRKKR